MYLSFDVIPVLRDPPNEAGIATLQSMLGRV